MTEATGGKKPAQGGCEDCGEWGYIPPGAVLMSKRSYRVIQACLLALLVSNVIILAGQWPAVWSRYFLSQSTTTGTAAITPPIAAIRAIK